jgi:hypothetical protein
MPRPWEADPVAGLVRRLGKSAEELGDSKGRKEAAVTGTTPRPRNHNV